MSNLRQKIAVLLMHLGQRIGRISAPMLRAVRPGEVFIFTEVYGCTKIGRIALESAYAHHPQTPIHIFGTLDDFAQLERRPTYIYHDISQEKKILENFNWGHLGTASLWAKVIQESQQQYIMHFDSDVIFRANVFDEIIQRLREGHSIVGPVRNYQHNPNNRDDVRYLADVSQTYCFGFDKTKVTARDYATFTKMCQGAFNPFGHPVIDFFDPVMFDIFRNGGTIHFLSPDDFGGCDRYGKRVNVYPEPNALMDFGKKIVHFSSVGSGMYYHLHPEKVGDKVPRTYSDYAKERYAVFCKLFYQEDIGVLYDAKKYAALFAVQDWYHT